MLNHTRRLQQIVRDSAACRNAGNEKSLEHFGTRLRHLRSVISRERREGRESLFKYYQVLSFRGTEMVASATI